MTTRPTTAPTETRRSPNVALVVVALAWALLTALVVAALRDPPQIERLTVANPHDWTVHVDVSSEDVTDGWLGLGRVEREQEEAFDGVLDQGETWVVRFTYAGAMAELHVTRTQLDQAGWRITVPDELARQLGAAGKPPTPR